MYIISLLLNARFECTVIISIMTSAVQEYSLQTQCCCCWFCVNFRCCQNTRFTVAVVVALQHSQYKRRKTSEQRKRSSDYQNVRLPYVRFGNPVNPSSVDVRQTRGTSAVEEDSIHVLLDATMFRFLSGFRRFERPFCLHLQTQAVQATQKDGVAFRQPQFSLSETRLLFYV